MSLIDLTAAAQRLPAWKSTVLAQVGGANIKVMKMDGAAYPDEVHDYPEGLLVIEGKLQLTLGLERITVQAGEIFIVPVGVPHAVAPGSQGTVVIFDTDD